MKKLIIIATILTTTAISAPEVYAQEICRYDQELRQVVCEEQDDPSPSPTSRPQFTASPSASPAITPRPTSTATPSSATGSGTTKGGQEHDASDVDADFVGHPFLLAGIFFLACSIIFYYNSKDQAHEILVTTE